MANHLSWILIAGTSSEPLTDELEGAAQLLGQALAAAGFGVVTCGWPGVDRAAGSAFVAEARRNSRDPATCFKQLHQRGRTPSVAEGQHVEVVQDAAEYLRAADVADAVVLVGGVVGTGLVYEHARLEKKLVLPLPRTEGNARDAFAKILAQFDREANLGVEWSELAALDRPAPEAVVAVVRLIRQHLEARAIRDGDYLLPEWITGADNEQAFARLVADMRRSQVLGFIGAGTSIPGGYPPWGALIDRMRAAMPAQVAKAMAYVLREEDLLMRAEHYRTVMGPAAYSRFLRDQFSEPRGTVKPLHLDLVRLPVAHMLTTNYDTLLERAHARVYPGELPQSVDWTNASAVEDFLRAARQQQEQRRYVHLHGIYSNPDGIVMTESDYQDRYHHTTAGESVLTALFTAHAFLFIGFSFSDIDVMGIFRATMARLGFGEPLHYALVALDPRHHDPTLVRQRLRQKFKIDPIFYLFTPDHAGLHPLISRLLAETAPASA